MGIVRKGDLCSGHGCFPARPAAEYSSDVYINGLEAVREQDLWEPHTCGSTHSGKVTEGSSTVFINGKGVVRSGDPIAECGSTAQQSSNNANAG